MENVISEIFNSNINSQGTQRYNATFRIIRIIQFKIKEIKHQIWETGNAIIL
jgi:hypothetical protein